MKDKSLLKALSINAIISLKNNSHQRRNMKKMVFFILFSYPITAMERNNIQQTITEYKNIDEKIAKSQKQSKK